MTACACTINERNRLGDLALVSGALLGGREHDGQEFGKDRALLGLRHRSTRHREDHNSYVVFSLPREGRLKTYSSLAEREPASSRPQARASNEVSGKNAANTVISHSAGTCSSPG